MTDFDMPATGTWEQRGGWVVRRLMTDLRLTDYQAAGLVGNLGFESGGFAELHEIGQPENSGGYGWAQWTASRRVTFLSWCDKSHLDWQSDEANYGFMLFELKSGYRGTVAALKNANTLEDAVFSVGQTYERPGGTTPTNLPGYDGRLTYAKRALAGSQTAPSPVSEPVLEDISAFDRIRAIQVILGVKPDAAFGRNSRAALNAILTVANQKGI